MRRERRLTEDVICFASFFFHLMRLFDCDLSAWVIAGPHLNVSHAGERLKLPRFASDVGGRKLGAPAVAP